MQIETFYDPATYTLTYVVFDENTKDALIIDPVLDYDPHASKTSTESLDKVYKFVEENGLNMHYCLETHAHADHLSGSVHLKEKYPNIKVAISEKITAVQDVFKGVFNFDFLKADGSQFDVLLKDNQEIEAGSLKVKVIATPGHTPACVSFLINDAVFTGDALFMPDYGTGRCDFPAGSASDLYTSIHDKLYALPDNTRVFVGHDYQPEGRELKWETSIAESKKLNKQLKGETSREDFVQMRESRDATLRAPRLLLQSVQVNINAGHFPESEENGKAYLKMPIK
jgi:glyoxylase-like metal-dependent hydrolase (beta-lactamase superfamily II)